MFFIYVLAPEFPDTVLDAQVHLYMHAHLRMYMVCIIHNALGTPKVIMGFAYEYTYQDYEY